MNRINQTLDLVLKHKWYDIIACGEKKEEYREIKPYYIHRIMKCDGFYDWCKLGCRGCSEFRKKRFIHSHVRFHRGYTSTTMTFEIESITIGKEREEWGADPGKDYFVIKLGKRLKETEI